MEISLWTIFWSIVGIIAWVLWGYPHWKVWASLKDGEAMLQESINEQQVQVTTAKARLDAAELNKKAAIVEAEAVAAQIEKIGQNLTKHDLFLKWQWIEMMQKGNHGSIIYVPTEAGLPILEAGNRK